MLFRGLHTTTMDKLTFKGVGVGFFESALGPTKTFRHIAKRNSTHVQWAEKACYTDTYACPEKNISGTWKSWKQFMSTPNHPSLLKSQIVHPQEHKQSLEITASSSCQNQKTNSKKRKILHYSRMTKRPTIVILLRYSCFTFIHLRIHRKKKQAGQVT